MNDRSRMLGGKGAGLVSLTSITGIKVPNFVVISGNIDIDDPAGMCAQTLESFLARATKQTFAVRSSAPHEDSASGSFAGMYSSVLSVPGTISDLCAAIKTVQAQARSKRHVLEHYASQRGIEPVDENIPVVVQEMVNATFSGIILSHGPSAQDGYYLVSTTKGSGELVASGTTNGQLLRIARAIEIDSLADAWLRELVHSMRIIEKHFASSSLDVEFAYEDDALHILQCRPLVTPRAIRVPEHAERALVDDIARTQTSIEASMSDDVLGDMIDINPAELLGASPSRLDVSVYRHLFADHIVEDVRTEMGYDPLGNGLIRMVADKPYVSLRSSAFSFRPKGIAYDTYMQMYGVYRRDLIMNPALQNRVEFSVFAMHRGERLEEVMRQADLTESQKSEVRAAYASLDTHLVSVSESVAVSFTQWAERYEHETERVRTLSPWQLLEHARNGTRQFVRVARLAFYWKNRFEGKHPSTDLNALLAGRIRTVSSELQDDLVKCRKGLLSREELIRRYGHLRPGQFGVFGESYADDPKHYLFSRLAHARETVANPHMHDAEMTVELKHVLTFMQARERAKFLFARTVSLFADALRTTLARAGIEQRSAATHDWDQLRTSLESGMPVKSSASAVAHLILPEVIIPGITNLGVISSGVAAPTYITRNVIKARVCVLESPTAEQDVEGALVVLPNADPGFDFLFHSGAAGIVTRTGGPASHMCIRAIELQMPACIGCGERTYEALLRSTSAILDCATGQVIIPV